MAASEMRSAGAGIAQAAFHAAVRGGDLRATAAAAMRARRPLAVDEILHSRHDVVAGNGVESAVRVAGGIPTLGGGARGGLVRAGRVARGRRAASAGAPVQGTAGTFRAAKGATA